MKFFWQKKPAPKQKQVYSGLSKPRQIVPNVPVSIKPKMPEIHNPLSPYIAVVHDDIKRLLHIDDKSRKNKETYKNFMEQYFKKP